jgi:hypothetical protein
MKNKTLLLFAIFLISTKLFAQSPEIGMKFNFDPKAEKDAKFVLKDNYNHYLLTVINVDGMLRNNSIILRKFDQKNKLVQTFTQEFGPKDVSFLNNYLGSFESGNDKIIVITESYSKKLNVKEISKHIFDKTTSKFETSLIASYPIESLMKSGTTYVRSADNNNFIGIDYVAYNSKSDPETNYITMLDANGLLVWKKEVSFDPGFVTSGLTITNSGKAVLLRNAKSYKENPLFTLISADKKEDKTVDIDIKLQQPKAISIGSKDYLIAFNYPSKGVRSCDFQDLLLYDLESGKILKNNRISEFNTTANLQEVKFKNVTLQNSEILIFVEAKSEIVVKQVPGAPISWDKNYKYENASLFIMSFDGVLKNVKKLIGSDNQYANFYNSYGLLNIKGVFHISNGSYNGQSNSISVLDASKNYDRDYNKNINLSPAFSQSVSQRMVNQLLCYFPDSKRWVVALMTDEKEMNLVNIYDQN